MVELFTGYQILETIHVGKYAELWRALRLSDDRRVVLKIVDTRRQGHLQLAQLEYEYEMLRGTRSPDLLQALELRKNPGQVALVMEDIGGLSLDRIMRETQPGIDLWLDIFVAFARQLDCLHRERIIHKNINPTNVIRNPITEVTRIIDFAMATRLSRENRKTPPPGFVEGALPYVSPEQTGRMNRTIDYRADFYMLGVSFYQLLTGRLPFRTRDPLELIHSHIARTPKSIREINPAVPEPLEAIVAALMAKNAEDRYQSAQGLIADLETCRLEFRRSGNVENFRLGAGDVAEIFSIPQKLYGREKEIDLLERRMRRVEKGGRELILIMGRSGEGKTALIREMHKPLAYRRGFLVSGRFERLQRNLPFGSLMRALGDLVRQLLAEREERLGDWRRRILSALGSNCAIMVDVVPELELIVGRQPEVPSLPHREAENRFHMVVHKFVSVFARLKYPLVLFLDDLQWADDASLELVQDLMMDSDIQALLLICTLQLEDEPTPVLEQIRRLQAEGVAVRERVLGALNEDQVMQMLAETLHLPEKAVAEPAAVVFAKTGGNPIFVNEFLHALYSRETIAFERESGTWRWNLTEMQRVATDGNALDLMIERIAHLPGKTASALRLAACIGNPFRLRDLAALLVIAPKVAAEMLWPAVEEGLIVPLDAGYNQLRNAGQDTGLETAIEFLHDQVRQAFPFSAAEKRHVHLRIGRMLSDQANAETNLFEVVSHYNLGRDLIAPEEERIKLASLNLAAGKKATGASAHESGLTFFRIAAGLMPESGWLTHYQTMREIAMERARCEFLCDFTSEADDLFADILERVHSERERAAVFKLRTILYTHFGRYLDAIEIGIQGLEIMGIELPLMDNLLQGRIQQRQQQVSALLGDRPVFSLLDARRLSDPNIRTALALLFNIWPAAVNVNRKLVHLIILEMLQLTLTHGNSDLAAYAYVGYALVLGSGFGDHERARAFGELGIRICDLYSNPAKKGPVYCLHASMVLPWVAHYREAIAYLRQAHAACMDSGDMMWAGQCLVHITLQRYLEGDPLPSISQELAGFKGFLEKSRHEQTGEVLTVLERMMDLFQGAWSEALNWTGGGFDEGAFLERNERKMYLISVTQFYLFKAQLAYYFDDLDTAVRVADRVARLAPYLHGWVSLSDHYLFMALIHARLADGAQGEARAEHLVKARQGYEQVRQWAAACPFNFEHARLLVGAELARHEADFEEVLKGYDAAIAAARAHEFLHLEALGCELAGRFLLGRGLTRIGLIYLRDACICYTRWGADAKVGKLAHDFPSLLEQPGLPPVANIAADGASSEREKWDMATLKKASLALSKEIHLATLLEKMIALVIENAGAQSGAFIIERDGELFVEAEGHAETGTTSVLGGLPLDEAERVSKAIVRSVYLVPENLVLANALREGRFSADPYIVTHHVKSVLCRPIMSKGQIAGILYLENRALTGAFTPHHLEILDLLTSDAAIAIENARLYAEVTATNARLEEYSRNLEEMVSERTHELRKKNRELEKTLARNREMQRQIIQQEKMASLGTLTAGVAHEIRNPLNFINNFADLSGELLAELSTELEACRIQSPAAAKSAAVDNLLADLKTNLSKIHSHGLRADEIVHSMLQHSHHKKYQMPEPTDINAMVDKYLTFACQGARVKNPDLNLTIKTHYTPGLVPVEANPNDLGRVFLNIAENACDAVLKKAADARGGYRPILTVGTRDAGDWVEIRIRDNGPGIERNDIHRIFNPFYTTKPAGSGTGLGLSISYDIVVKEHRGSIEVETQEGKFTEFSVRLPKKQYKPQTN